MERADLMQTRGKACIQWNREGVKGSGGIIEALNSKLRKPPTATSTDNMGKKVKTSFQLKTPKGTKDCKSIHNYYMQLSRANVLFEGEGADMVMRDRIFSTIIEVFKRHGAVTIDTCVLIS